MSTPTQPLTTAAKLATAKEKKDVADQAFKAGDIKGGAKSSGLDTLLLT